MRQDKGKKEYIALANGGLRQLSIEDFEIANCDLKVVLKSQTEAKLDIAKCDIKMYLAFKRKSTQWD